MKNFVKSVLLLIFALSMGSQLWAGPMMTGVERGKWTMDYEAALKYAQKNNLPVFLKFTGSDWCKWCILMEKSVFTKQEWSDFAKDNIVLVTLDFPRHYELPAGMAERNQQLAQQMGIQGYPTYIILDSDGKTRLGQLGAGEDKTAASFIQEVKHVIRYSHAGIERFASKLDKSKKEKYISSFNELKQKETDLSNWSHMVTSWTPENIEKYHDYEAQLRNLNNTIRDIEIDHYASKLSTENAQEYRILNSRLKATQAEYDAWLGTRPQRTEENNKIYMDYQEKLQNLSSAISEFEN